MQTFQTSLSNMPLLNIPLEENLLKSTILKAKQNHPKNHKTFNPILFTIRNNCPKLPSKRHLSPSSSPSKRDLAKSVIIH